MKYNTIGPSSSTSSYQKVKDQNNWMNPVCTLSLNKHRMERSGYEENSKQFF